MKRITSTLIISYIFLLMGFSCFGQNAQPTQTPSGDDTVRISTKLVQFDVTVTDKNGKIITDLKPEDFEIFENGEQREITNFLYVSPLSKIAPQPNSKADTSSTNVQISPEKVRRIVVLVVDDLSISYDNMRFVKKSLRRFVDEQMRDGDLVAISRTGGGIGMLEQFTSNRQLLYAAIEKIRWNPLGLGTSKLEPPDVDPSAEFKKDDPRSLTNIGSRDLRDPKEEAKQFRQSAVAAGAINNLRYVVSGMKNMPGRKSMIFFSEGFKLTRDTPVGKEPDYRLHDAFEKLFDTAARSSVVVNTIDARGLEPDRDDDFDEQQDGLVYLAKQTGGTAVKNNNDFNLGVEKILNGQKNYYLIGFTPGDESFDAKTRRFNKFVVKVKREGLTANYRSGFLNVSEEESQKLAKQTPAERFKAALISPFATNDIALNLNALFSNDVKQGSFVRSLLHINAKDLKFSDEAGGKKASFDVLAISFDEKGAPVDKIIKNFTLNLPIKEYQKFLVEGFVYHFTFPIKKPGAYQLRVAIRDNQSEKIGSASQFIEVPNLEKDGLTLSGVVLENLTREQWQKEAQQTSQSGFKVDKIENQGGNTLLTDTSLKQFKRGTVLRYGFEIYNAKLDNTRKPQITTQIKIFRDEKLLLEGAQSPIDVRGQNDLPKATSFGAVVLGSEMTPGDYVLQVIVTDNLSKGKDKITTQLIPFEIVE